MERRTDLETGLMLALERLLLVAGALDTRFEAEAPDQTLQVLIQGARDYGATVRALEQAGPYSWALRRLSDGMTTGDSVPVRPKTDDMME